MASGLKAKRDEIGTTKPVRRVGTLREQQKQFTRERLLSAALEVFVEDGYGPARVEDIAARAGASRATFYLHFRGKADLVEALMDQVEPAEDERWTALGSAERRSVADAKRWLTALTDLWDANRAYFGVLEQAVAVEAEVATRYSAARRRRTKLVARGSETRALLLVVQLERFCHLWLDGDAGVDRRAAIAELASVWAED